LKGRAMIYILLSLVLLSIITVSSSYPTESKSDYTPSIPWTPPDDYVDPVTLKIREFREQGMNDTQITEELEKLGMGWWPPSGATWIGRRPTPEEQAKLP